MIDDVLSCGFGNLAVGAAMFDLGIPGNGDFSAAAAGTEVAQASSSRSDRDAAIAREESAPTAMPRGNSPTLRGARHEDSVVMIVDDEPINIKVVQKYLKSAGYSRFITASDSRNVYDQVLAGPPDVLLLDVMMPQVSGIELLRRIRDDTRLGFFPIIILTAADNQEMRIYALELGATDFLTKPVNAAELVARVRNSLMLKAHQNLKDYSQELEEQVRHRTAELAASRLELIHCLARAAEFRDNETGHHVIRVGCYAGIIARKLGLPEDMVELIEHAAPLHDMGKVGISDSILLKPGKLTPDEFDMMKQHSVFGKRTFEPMSSDEWHTFKSHTLVGENILGLERSPLIVLAGKIALTHHERWDGTGYPLGLKAEEIPLAGRITAVADVFDALSTRRPYKPEWPLDRCFAAIEEGRGTQFDPTVADAFLASREQVVQVRMRFADAE